MASFYLDFEPVGRRGNCRADESLLESARQLGVELNNICGGLGICERCVVQVLEGGVSEITDPERDALSEVELAQGFRLACMTYPLEDCKLGVPAESLSTPMRTQIEGIEVEVALNPAVRTVAVTLTPPSLTHPLGDAENLLHHINQIDAHGAEFIDLPVLQELSPNLREWQWRCNARLYNQEVVAITPVKVVPLGLAVDLGSTKIAGYLVNLHSGQTLAAHGLMNPQINYGEDIISRCAYAAKSPKKRQQMQQIVVDSLNQLVADLCAAAGMLTSQIIDAVIVGNTAMHHLLLGLSTRQLVAAPYTATTTTAVNVKAREIGLAVAPGAYLHLPPNVAGFVGGDHVAMLLATVAGLLNQTVIALDIGTNTEISLVTAAGQMRCLSCASGPAFEGYHIKDGIRAGPGAIEKVSLSGGDVFLQTIENESPVGICGSGILDTVAQFQLAGVINANGRLMLNSHQRLRERGDEREFVLAPADGETDHKEIIVNQNDVREIQLAKAAIQTGIQVLLAESGVSVADIDQIIIAGAFGSYIDVANAVAIGMLPSLPLEKFKQVGNAAGIGAKMALLSTAQRDLANIFYNRLNYVELAKYPKFAYLFAKNCRLRPDD